MYALVIYENGRINVLARGETEAELRGMWASARHAVIAQGGTVVAVKPGTATQAAAELRTAVRLGVDGPAAPLANPLRGVPVTRDRSVVREKPEEEEGGEGEGEEPEPQPEADDDAEEPAPAKPRPPHPAPVACIRPGCGRPTRRVVRGAAHKADPALSALCDSCKATAYRIIRERKVSPTQAVAVLRETPRGQAPLPKMPAPSRAKLAAVPRPKPAAEEAPAPEQAAPAAPTPASDLPALLAEAGEALRLCRAYGGVAAVRAVLEQLDAWRREAA